MLLSAMLLAAAVQATPLVPPSEILARGGRVTVYASKDQALQAMKAESACRESGLQLAEQPAPDVAAKVKRLGDLPPANHTLTVLRSVDGCPVSSTIRFNVDRPARR
ncbi:hypothetical protein PMI01_01128 [Caulobacter sp. AP07]|uniref:hypothetical protein n=1 Tax=Caulobacter sp. AP07 TaxID=1144304 RepID=UPI000271E374|nr:hypothetical protein [Caulobacter sp. AP07]EJL36057.1 hypothetical protein PMI01_01128 [Caulobacter sp. AP07]